MRCIQFLQRKHFVFLFAIVALFAAIPTPSHAQALITSKTIIEATNLERRSDGEKALVSDAALTEIAAARLKDMFARQYFAHTSPTGQTVGKLALSKEYDYAIIGENLALGSYVDTADLVNAWMESKGHKENILRDNYTSIGVAVGTGILDGEETMIAVQVFSRPLALCPQPSGELKQSILAGQSYVQKVTSLVNAYIRTGVSLPRTVSNQISTLMALFNKDLNNKVAEYNEQVVAFESCTRG